MLEIGQDGFLYVPKHSRKRLFCAICEQMIESAVKSINCEHSYCQRCVEHLITNSPTVGPKRCPQCTTPFSEDQNQIPVKMKKFFIEIDEYYFEIDDLADHVIEDYKRRLYILRHKAETDGNRNSSFHQDTLETRPDKVVRVCGTCQTPVRGNKQKHICFESILGTIRKWSRRFHVGVIKSMDFIDQIDQDQLNGTIFDYIPYSRGCNGTRAKSKTSRRLQKQLYINHSLQRFLRKTRSDSHITIEELNQEIEELERHLLLKEQIIKQFEERLKLEQRLRQNPNQVIIETVYPNIDFNLLEKLKRDNILLRNNLNEINQKYSKIKEQKRETDEEFKKFMDQFDQQKYELTTIKSTIAVILTNLPNNIIIISDFTLFLDYIVDNIKIDLAHIHYIGFESEENAIALRAEYRDVVKVMFSIHPNLRIIILEISDHLCQQIQSQLDLRDTTNILIDNHSEDPSRRYIIIHFDNEAQDLTILITVVVLALKMGFQTTLEYIEATEANQILTSALMSARNGIFNAIPMDSSSEDE